MRLITVRIGTPRWRYGKRSTLSENTLEFDGGGSLLTSYTMPYGRTWHYRSPGSTRLCAGHLGRARGLIYTVSY